MSIWNKIKNALFEEEEYTVEEEIEVPVKKKAKKKEDKVAKKVDLSYEEEKKEEVKEPEEIIEEEVKEEKIDSFSSRLEKRQKFYDEDDFKEDSVVVEEKPVLPAWKESPTVYNLPKTENQPYEGVKAKEKQFFKPTPIISPVYGILDKNYRKEDVVSKKEIRLSASSSRRPDLDTVREKAYGDSTMDLEEVIVATEEEKAPTADLDFVTEEIVDDKKQLIDLSSGDGPAVDKVTMGDAEEYFNELGLEYNVDYKDNSVEKTPTRRSDKNLDAVEKEKVEETDDDGDNLFDLIESMYEEDK